MALAYLGVHRSQHELARQLGVQRYVGAPASHLLRLRTPKIDVFFVAEAEIDSIHRWLARGLPVIAFVQTNQLAYWRGETAQHAVIVVGMTERLVHLLDPAQSEVVIAVPVEEFWLAWDELGLMFGVIAHR
jgi:ABC-type bacteriocin/lantibiotic exporter with double-glycine peptidase domain